MRKLFIIILIVFSVVNSCLNVSANEIYEEQLEGSGIEKINEYLPNETIKELEERNITLENTDWLSELKVKNVFEEIFFLIKSGGMQPLKAAAQIIGVLILWSVIRDMATSEEIRNIASYSTFVICLLIVINPISNLILSTVDVIKSSAVFMLAFIPIFAGILLATGRSISATGYSSVMLFFTESVSTLSSNFLTPLCSMFLAIGVSGAFLSEFKLFELGATIKKIAVWFMSFVSIIFLGILGMQNVIGAAVESAGTKTLKFVVGSFVPVVGNAVSESILTVKSCLNLLSSTAGVYVVIAVVLMMAPIIIELLLWRISLIVIRGVAGVLSCERIEKFSQVLEQTLSLMLAIVLFIVLMFVLSITIVTITGK